MMKKVIVIFLVLGTINGFLLVEEDKSIEKFSTFVENLVDDFNKKNSMTHDVALLKLGLYKETRQKVDDVFDAIIRKVSGKNSVMMPNLAETSKNRDMRKAEITVIVSDVFNSKLLLRRFSKTENSQFWNSKSKFIYILTRKDRKPLASVSSFFYTMGLLDAVFVGLKRNGDLEVKSYNPFEKEAGKRIYEVNLENGTTIDVVFPDKLKNLKGYKYKMMFKTEFPNVFIEKTEKKINFMSGINIKLLDTVATHQNASLRFFNIDDVKNQDKAFINALNTKQADLSLNTEFVISGRDADKYKLVNTYETNGFCIILPYPPSKSFFEYVMKPFDLWTWACIMTSLFGLVAAWHFLNKYSSSSPDSAGYFLFGFVAFFLGQGVEFRNNRLMQKILIQLMVMMTFILGNAYQSVLTSQMAEAREGERIVSVQEAIDSDFRFLADPLFMIKLKSSDLKHTLGPKINGDLEYLNSLSFENLAAERIGVILSCNHVGDLYHNTGKISTWKESKKTAINYYYRVPGKIFTYYSKFPTAAYSMFAERLQEYSLRIHESGIKDHWKTLQSFEDLDAIKKRQSDANEEFYLNLRDMTGAFYGLGIGFTLATIAFLLEIFYDSCLKYLKWKNIKRAIRRKIRRWAWRNKVAPLQVIQVQPRVQDV